MAFAKGQNGLLAPESFEGRGCSGIETNDCPFAILFTVFFFFQAYKDLKDLMGTHVTNSNCKC